MKTLFNCRRVCSDWNKLASRKVGEMLTRTYFFTGNEASYEEFFRVMKAEESTDKILCPVSKYWMDSSFLRLHNENIVDQFLSICCPATRTLDLEVNQVTGLCDFRKLKNPIDFGRLNHFGFQVAHLTETTLDNNLGYFLECLLNSAKVLKTSSLDCDVHYGLVEHQNLVAQLGSIFVKNLPTCIKELSMCFKGSDELLTALIQRRLRLTALSLDFCNGRIT